MTKTKIKPNTKVFPEVAKLLSGGKAVILAVKGQSMYPFIVGDRDKVVLSKQDSVRVGNIVMANVKDFGFIMHRIIKIKGQNVTLMGDGNARGREYCTLDDIVATVKYIYTPKRVISTASLRHRALARVWRLLLPVRSTLLAICRRLS